MTHNPYPDPTPPTNPDADPEAYSRSSWILFAIGAATMIIGYICLAQASSNAGNLFGKISAFLIVGGLAIFGAGFAFKPK